MGIINDVDKIKAELKEEIEALEKSIDREFNILINFAFIAFTALIALILFVCFTS
jgi:uncharacterized membrane protein